MRERRRAKRSGGRDFALAATPRVPLCSNVSLLACCRSIIWGPKSGTLTGIITELFLVFSRLDVYEVVSANVLSIQCFVAWIFLQLIHGFPSYARLIFAPRDLHAFTVFFLSGFTRLSCRSVYHSMRAFQVSLYACVFGLYYSVRCYFMLCLPRLRLWIDAGPCYPATF